MHKARGTCAFDENTLLFHRVHGAHRMNVFPQSPGRFTDRADYEPADADLVFSETWLPVTTLIICCR